VRGSNAEKARGFMRKEVNGLKRSGSEPCSAGIKSDNGASPDGVKELGIFSVFPDQFS
jgi:hypothetical protein